MTVQTQHPGGTLPRGWHMPHITLSAFTVFALVLVLLLLGISAASQTFAPQPALNTVNLNDSDAGKQVVLTSGAILVVSLSGNPTTGYQWLLDSTDAAILKPMGEPEFKADSALIGSGGTFTWRFSAVSAGQVPLHLVYRRSWELDTPPPRTFEVTVVVK